MYSLPRFVALDTLPGLRGATCAADNAPLALPGLWLAIGLAQDCAHVLQLRPAQQRQLGRYRARYQREPDPAGAECRYWQRLGSLLSPGQFVLLLLLCEQ